MNTQIAELDYYNHLSLLFNGVTDSLFLINVESEHSFQLIEVNQAYIDVTGFKKEDILFKRVEEILYGDAAQFVISKYQEAINKKTTIQYEETVVLPAGKFVFEIKLTPVCSEGKCTHILGAMRDITKRVHTEELLRKTGMLSAAGQLAASIAHEIRNPLTSLKGFIQLIEADCKTKKEYFEIMNSELERIEEILSDLLFLVKPTQGNFSTVNIQYILEQSIKIMKPQALLNNVIFRPSFEHQHPIIHGNEKQLKQVFINIIKNAIEVMPSGGPIKIQLLQNLSQIIVRFIDRGKGIPEEIISKLGEAFFTTKEVGTGLGLMVSKQIIENHGGLLNISSQINKGTTVEIILPAKIN